MANVADGPGLAFARGQVATYLSVFAHVVAMAEPGIWRGRRFGNVVLAASAVRCRCPAWPGAALVIRCRPGSSPAPSSPSWSGERRW